METLATLGVGAACAAALLTAYCARVLPSVPEVQCVDNKHNRALLAKCAMLRDPYQPPVIWGWNGHLQTAFFAVGGRSQPPKLSTQRTTLDTADGSQISLDVFSPADATPSTPVIFVIPGICNSSENAYIRGFAAFATASGRRVVVFNHHGAVRDLAIGAARLFTFGGTADCELAMRWTMDRFPAAPIVGAGFSMGGNLIVRLAALHPDIQERLACVVSVCQGYDIMSASSTISASPTYEWGLLRGLRRLVQQHEATLRKLRPDIDLDAVCRSQTLSEFDRHFTLKACPELLDHDNYYRSHSCAELLEHVHIPLLLVNADDDPLVAPVLLEAPKRAAQQKPNVVFVRTRHGGHLGFFEGTFMPRAVSWLDRLVLSYVDAELK